MRAVSDAANAASDCASESSGCPSQIRDLHGGEGHVRPHAPPDLGVLGDRAGVVEEADEALVLVPGRERVGDAAAGEEAREDLGPGRMQAGVDVLHEGRAAREREELREEVAQRACHRDRPVGTVDRDVDVEPERVVAPDDVAQQLVVSAVVRGVDDALVLPVRPGMGARRAEEEPHAARRAPAAASGAPPSLRERRRRSRSAPSAPRPRRRSAHRRGAPRATCPQRRPARPRTGS